MHAHVKHMRLAAPAIIPDAELAPFFSTFGDRFYAVSPDGSMDPIVMPIAENLRAAGWKAIQKKPAADPTSKLSGNSKPPKSNTVSRFGKISGPSGAQSAKRFAVDRGCTSTGRLLSSASKKRRRGRKHARGSPGPSYSKVQAAGYRRSRSQNESATVAFARLLLPIVSVLELRWDIWNRKKALIVLMDAARSSLCGISRAVHPKATRDRRSENHRAEVVPLFLQRLDVQW